MDPLDVLEFLGLDGQAVGAEAEPGVRQAVADRWPLPHFAACHQWGFTVSVK